MAQILYKITGKISLFDKENTKEKLSKLGNPLEKLHKIIDFEMFIPELKENMLNHDKKNNAGAKPCGVVMMFKIMLLKIYYNISYEQTEYQTVDSASFKEFLGLDSGDKNPDARSIWDFQDRFIKKRLDTQLFDLFHQYLKIWVYI